ncbi:MAG: type IV pilin N-terminal domain-containing protein [Methanosarcinales archaeon Met12]|nr:MAG: type IV pilin N-terminal domain-containing protein [Methanosarcinales archaeon Met12]
MNRLPKGSFTDRGIDENAVSPIIGVILMVALTVLLAAIIGALAFGIGTPERVPLASIVVENATGGLLHSQSPEVKFGDNWITFIHRGGDSLNISWTKIIITGYGEAQNITGGAPGTRAGGDIVVVYENLEYDGKYKAYKDRNIALNDGIWSAGEVLILNGHDSKEVTRPASTVTVSIADVSVTSDNWRFKGNSKITITVMDIPSGLIIARSEVVVRQVVK